MNEALPPRDPVMLRLAVRLLVKAERATGNGDAAVGVRAARLRLDRRELPELHDQVDADAIGRIELRLHELCDAGWVRLVLAPARDFAGFTDRKPQLELVDFDALAAWAGHQRLADRWQRKLVAHLALHWNGTPGEDNDPSAGGYADRSPEGTRAGADDDPSAGGYADRSLEGTRAGADDDPSAGGYADRSPKGTRAGLGRPGARPAGAKAELLDHLSRNPLGALAFMPPDEAMQRLVALQRLCAGGVSMPLREASARVFHGRSKVLDRRDELLRLLGAVPGQFWDAPVQLLVDLPEMADAGSAAVFDAALFVENLVSFERMADARQAAWARSVLVFASGFKGSAKRLRQRDGCRIYVRAPCAVTSAPGMFATKGLQAVDAWLFGGAGLPVYFFGDLDFSGMQILASLRDVFPHAEAWRPGYDDLLAALRAGGGHPPETAAKEGQIDPGATGCAYADTTLLPAMRRHGRFVDQEGFGGLDAPSAPDEFAYRGTATGV